MKFKTGDTVLITRPENWADVRETDWVCSMNEFDGEIVTLDTVSSVNPPTWRVKEVNWEFEEAWMTLTTKFKAGDEVLIQKPIDNRISPMWLDDEMLKFDGDVLILKERNPMFGTHSWRVEGSHYTFQENWMTLVEDLAKKEEENMNNDGTCNTTKPVERIGPAVRTNGFTQDYEKTNPALHMLYVHYAMHSLKSLKSCLADLTEHSRISMMDAASAIQTEIRKLIDSDPAYRHAAALLFADVCPLPLDTKEPRYPLVPNMPKLNSKLFPPGTEVEDKSRCACGMSECCKNLLDDN